MIDIDQILALDSAEEIISALTERTTIAPKWETLVVDYDPKKHPIMEDNQGRKDKNHQDGTTDKAARLSLGLEKLITKRMTEYTFATPVKRVYTYANEESGKQKDIAKAIERIYNVAHIDAENKRRGIAYFASCECVTIWYTKREEKEHNLYGFPCKNKLKCKTFSPMDGHELYPLIDEYGEMYAMSYQYRKKVKDTWVTFFETFTKDKHRAWKKGEDSEWESTLSDDDLSIGKIPAIYIYRPAPIWDGLTHLREDIEYTISRNSDVLAYNSAPILKVAGNIVGDEIKGETRRVYRVMEGGDVSYVSWSQSIDALRYHVQTLLNLYFMQAQIPDVSFENLRNLGNIGYDARKLLFTDVHMKVGDESGALIEFLEREGNVIKAFLKEMNKSAAGLGFSSEDVDAVRIEHIITPYIQEDEKLNIDKWITASGGVPLVSPIEAIKFAGLSSDPERTLADSMAYQLALNGKEEGTTEQAEPSE